MTVGEVGLHSLVGATCVADQNGEMRADDSIKPCAHVGAEAGDMTRATNEDDRRCLLRVRVTVRAKMSATPPCS